MYAANCTIVTRIILKLLGLCMQLLPSAEGLSDASLDEVEHGEKAYHSPTRAFEAPKQVTKVSVTTVTPFNSSKDLY